VIRGQSIVCFANDWNADPTSKHQLMRRFAAANRVLWVESPGMRTPRLTQGKDLRRIGAKLRTLGRPAEQRLPNLYVCAPPTLPFPRSPLARAVNGWLYRRSIRRELDRLSFDPRPIVWAFAPHVAPAIPGLPRRLLVYHCVDRWSAFADYDQGLMNALEADMCRAADVVIASAQDLADHCRQYNDAVHYVPHGVDTEHFGQALEPGDLPAELAAIPEPRVGFFGVLHEWVDVELIAALARRTPFHYVLLGEVWTDLSALAGLANVHVLGRKPYQRLPDFCRGFRAGIVPFRLNALTRSVNPIKLREYAAAGLPVVSTALPEVERAGDFVDCPRSEDEWVAAVSRAVARGASGGERRRQAERVRTEGWQAIAARIGGILAQRLEETATPRERSGVVPAARTAQA
jgi:glycosyltransferase involved in cell wall biosynthesis